MRLKVWTCVVAVLVAWTVLPLPPAGAGGVAAIPGATVDTAAADHSDGAELPLSAGDSNTGSGADLAEEGSAEQAYQTVVSRTDGLAALLAGTVADSAVVSVVSSGEGDLALSMGADGSDRLKIPSDPSDPIRMTRAEGASLGVRLPGTPTRVEVVGYDGARLMLFEDVAGDTDVLVQPQNDAGVRVLTVIGSSAAPKSFDYQLELDVGHNLIPLDGGQVVVVDSESIAVSVIEAPWAFDAAGNSVKTFYSIAGNILTLNVAHDDSTAYPVLADPVFTWGNVSGTVYFSRSETLNISIVGAIPIAVFLALPNFVTGTFAAISAGVVGWAASAIAQYRTCLKFSYGISFSWGIPRPFAALGHYQDEAGVRCR